jgi:hypothetical protein
MAIDPSQPAVGVARLVDSSGWRTLHSASCTRASFGLALDPNWTPRRDSSQVKIGTNQAVSSLIVYRGDRIILRAILNADRRF